MKVDSDYRPRFRDRTGGSLRWRLWDKLADNGDGKGGPVLRSRNSTLGRFLFFTTRPISVFRPLTRLYAILQGGTK